MEGSDLPPPASLSEKKENVAPISPRIAELTESRSELHSRIQNLKQDLQKWRTKLDSQVKVYHDELAELKKSLNTEVEQLRTEFQVLKVTLQQQQEDVSSSLKKLGDGLEVKPEAAGPEDMESKEMSSKQKLDTEFPEDMEIKDALRSPKN
ncbi:uncharacterized protein LOC127250480 isoform X2 [Andrographis paniculata]|uniref:uncharacterized protein LOC127250480 isoform X2 n=1 Tax=Andrographis paniculata TaxID=175694 RepID=UPI0021E73F8C|nr:uncharacterized protein LOC127250480 isoform X2 [Andrographis paniculata]